VNAALPIYEWLKLDRVVSSQVRVRGWQKDPRESLAGRPTAHGAVEIALVQSGTLHYRIGDREIVVPEGHVMVVPRDVEHTTTFMTPMHGVALWLGEDLVAQISDAMGPETSARMLAPGAFVAKNGRIASLLSVLVEEVTDAGAGHTRAAEAICESIVIETLRRAPRSKDPTSARDPRVRAAIGQMQASYADALTVDDLAKTAKMSRFHFSRLFRDEVGDAPYQFLLRIRIARAVELLRGGHHSVTEAALACGFSDFSRFASTFRKHTGKLPTAMLREARSA
jgi:AraC family transcriptional regulator